MNRFRFSFSLFVPPHISSKPLNLQELFNLTGKNYAYYSHGRYAIYHALKALKIKGKVILPCYICPTVIDSIIAAGLKPVFCDIDIQDLNISFDSFVEASRESDVHCVIVPSLYGNPADLSRFEEYCFKNNIAMIDDGAQSFGANVDGRYVSSFGNSGLFAFSPGKATPGPMGALQWCDETAYFLHRKKHALVHRVIYKNYRINREGAYENYLKLTRYFWSFAATILERCFNIQDDDACVFEKNMMGGVIDACISKKLDYRKQLFISFTKLFDGNKIFSIVKCQRGEPVNHKIVLIFNDIETAKEFKGFLATKQVCTFSGYKMNGDLSNEPNAFSLQGRIIELPIENDSEKMKCLYGYITSFCNDRTLR